MLRRLIVDDNPRFVDAARGLLEREGVAEVGVASTGTEPMQRIQELRPDVTLVDIDIDIDLGAESGFDVAMRIHKQANHATSPVIPISAYDEQAYAELIAASPALGFVSRSALSASAARDLPESRGEGRERPRGHRASRNVITAKTRRWSTSLSGRFSLARMLRTCFSTVPPVTTS
jgi:CheY-like chemotaxis protein